MSDNVQCQVIGGEVRTEHGLAKVKDAYGRLQLSGEYTATINGEPASMDDSLSDYHFVSFAKAVKGGFII